MKKLLKTEIVLFIFYAFTFAAYCCGAEDAGRTFTNSIGQTFVLIPAGSFIMGSPEEEPGHNRDENRHRVKISKPFYMQTTEVTQGQWRTIMGNNPSYFKNCGNDCPVEQVSWHEVQGFIERLNKKEDTDKYVLPSEAQWEYACRAGAETALYTGPLLIFDGNNSPSLDPIAWYGGNSCADYEGGFDCSRWSGKQEPCAWCGIQPVGLKQPNAWGLYDMIGNVWEWCADCCCYKAGAGVVTDTYRDGIVDPVCMKGADRVFRGGSWYSSAGVCRSAYRLVYNPDRKGNYLGFRIIRRAPIKDPGS